MAIAPYFCNYEFIVDIIFYLRYYRNSKVYLLQAGTFL